MQYLIGRRVRFSVQVKTYPGLVLTDPANLKLTIKNKTTGVSVDFDYPTDVEVVKDNVGLYHCDYTPITAGAYWYRFSCTGIVEDAGEDNFSVVASQVI